MLGTIKIANILRAFHQNTTAAIKSGTISFKLGSGVRQGSDEGPNLFCLFLQYVLSVVEAEIKTSVPDAGVNFKFEILSECNPRKLRSTGPASGSRRMFKILYADDNLTFDTDETRLNKVLAVVESVFTRFGPVVAENKTKSMSFNLKPDEQPATFQFSTGALEKVKKFRYLGYHVSSDSPTLFVDMQIQAAFTAFNSNRRALTNPNISLQARVSLLDGLVRSRLLYSVQAWNLTQLEKERLDVIYRSVLRKMVYKGYAKKDPQNGDYSFIISNQKLYEITRTVPLQDFIDKQFLKFQAHVTRLQNNKLQKQLQFMIPDVKNTQNLWNKCGKLLGGYDGIQARRLMQSHAFVTCRLDNCNSLLYGPPKHLVHRLQLAQNCAARLILCGRKHDHIAPLLKELH